jgi:hypothetical protein
MKALKNILSLLVLSSSVLVGCKTEIDLTGPFEEIPVVVGVLNQADSIQYIRVNRTFIGPGDATEIALIPDSNFFKNIEVTVTEGFGVNKRIWVLRDTIVQDKENGAFFTSPNKVYYFKVDPNEAHNVNSQTSRLNENTSFRLDININEGAINYYAETELVKNFTIAAPAGTSQLNFSGLEPGSSILVDKDIFININEGNATRINYEYFIDYEEHTSSGSEIIRKTFAFGESALSNGDASEKNLSGTSMYAWLRNVVPLDSDVTKRSIIGAGIKATGASTELDQYIIASQPTSSLAQSKPTYSNIIQIVTDESGETSEVQNKAIGFFGSRASHEFYKIANPAENYGTVFNGKTLQGHSNLGLGFCTEHSFSSAESYYCP